MVTMTVFVDGEVFCCIKNGLNHNQNFEGNEIKEVSLKKKQKYPYEVQVPIQIIGTFTKKNKTTINLDEMLQLNKKSIKVS